MSKRIPDELIPPRVAIMVAMRFKDTDTEESIRTTMQKDYDDFCKDNPSGRDIHTDAYVQFCQDAAVQTWQDLVLDKPVAVSFNPNDDPKLAELVTLLSSLPGVNVQRFHMPDKKEMN